MTGDAVKEALLEIVAKYDRGIFTEDDARERAWDLAQLVDDTDRQRISVSSHDD